MAYVHGISSCVTLQGGSCPTSTETRTFTKAVSRCASDRQIVYRQGYLMNHLQCDMPTADPK